MTHFEAEKVKKRNKSKIRKWKLESQSGSQIWIPRESRFPHYFFWPFFWPGFTLWDFAIRDTQINHTIFSGLWRSRITQVQISKMKKKRKKYKRNKEKPCLKMLQLKFQDSRNPHNFFWPVELQDSHSEILLSEIPK